MVDSSAVAAVVFRAWRSRSQGYTGVGLAQEQIIAHKAGMIAGSILTPIPEECLNHVFTACLPESSAGQFLLHSPDCRCWPGRCRPDPGRYHDPPRYELSAAPG